MARASMSLLLPALCVIPAFSVAALAAFPGIFASEPSGADEKSWPQWRGPERSGISTETGWAVEGTELWKKEVGLGYSSASIVDGRLYTQGFVPASEKSEEGEDVIWCLDAATGKELWSHRFPAKRWAMAHNGGTNVTPSVEDGRVYTCEREGDFFCLDAKSGKVLWKRNAKNDAGIEKLPTWGYAAAPLVLEDAIYLNAGSVIAYDKKSGEVRWKSEDLGHAYATPADFTWNGKKCLAVFNGGGLNIIDRSNGKRYLNHAWKTNYDVNAATPIVIGEKGDQVFISSGYNHGCALLKLGAEAIEPVWESKVMRNHMSGCVLFEGHLYGFDEKKLKCIDLAGKELWAQEGLGKGALIIAGGKLVIISDKGDLAIADATPQGYNELSRTNVLQGSVCWTTPTLLNGLIYARNQGGTLVCRDHRKKASK
ncbi:MAG: PQQ-like beta-propeller repeat protein [Planctomycetes bacterium]|nr:PQQ-like beta-propeller repeat protein [Planctomycetota bacterium]